MTLTVIVIVCSLHPRALIGTAFVVFENILRLAEGIYLASIHVSKVVIVGTIFELEVMLGHVK